MTLLLTMLFACGEKEVTTEVASTTTEVVETKTKETTDEETTDNTIKVTKDATSITSGESEAEVTTTSTNTNKGVNND